MSSLISFSGLASGIDTTALIDAMTSASRAQSVTPYQTQVTDLTETNSVLEELKARFNELKESIYQFSTISGGGISKTALSTNEAYAGAIASNAATNGTYALTVTQLARNGTYTYGHSFSSLSDVVASSSAGHSSGTVTVEVGQGSDMKTISVAVTADSTTLSDFVSAFNEQAAQQGSAATASAVNVGTSSSPDYRIMISSTNTGEPKGTLNITTNVGYVSTLLGGGVMNNAENAVFTLNGVTGITRETNTISDIITGVTFNLQGIGSSTISVADDSMTTATNIQDFVDKYNEIVEFIAENNQILRDESGSEVRNIFQPLASTSTDDTALRLFRDVIAGTRSEVSGTGVNIFADLGITTQRDGTLKFDRTQFQTASAESSTSVNSILQQFADTVSTTGGTIDGFTRFQGSFDLTISSNRTLIDDMNKRIAEAEQSISDQEDTLRARFSRLEAVIGKMQSQQQALSGLISSMG